MLDHSIKAHCGRSPSNRTDSLCIVEYGSMNNCCFAQITPDKSAATITPIIERNVCARSIVWTDEHGAYNRLNQIFAEHRPVRHKYEFVNSIDGTHTQAVESFHNEMKLEIKRRKGIKTEDRPNFIK